MSVLFNRNKNMTLKQILRITFGMAATLLVSSCSQEKFPDMPDDGGARPLRITVTDGGYAADGKNDTRAVEDGYTTVFTAGDACGLYIVRKGSNVVCDNVKLTATEGADGTLTWQPAEGETLTGGYTGETYFLYYPYQPDMTGKINASSTSSDTGFFKTLISGWQPAADQSIYAKYTACDLMTAKCSTTEKTDDGKLLLTFSLTHRMALAVIDVPKTVYHFTNKDVSISDYVVAPVDFTGSDVKPWRCGADGTYRCIMKPASSTAVNIIGVYYDEGNKEFMAALSNIAAGNYKRYVVDGAPVVTKKHLLQLGDYYLTNGHLLPKDATLTNEEKKKVIGIVFYAGHHPEDDSGYYYYSGIALTKCHGYVVALDDVSKGCAWGANRVFGCNNGTLSKDDWNGYEWTRKIIDYVEGVDNLGTTATGYPATYYAVVKNGETYPINGGSGWFLPSSGQMWNIYENQGALFTSLGSTLKSFEGAPFESYVGYWSSSEPSTTYNAFTLGIRANETEAGIYTSSKSSWRSIRSVLAF